MVISSDLYNLDTKISRDFKNFFFTVKIKTPPPQTLMYSVSLSGIMQADFF